MKRFRLIAAAIATVGAIFAILLTWEITNAQSPDNAAKQAAEPVDAIRAFTPQNEPAGSNKLLKPELKAGQAHESRSQLTPVPVDPPKSMSNEGSVSQIQSATKHPSNTAFDDATAKQSEDSTPKQTLKVFSLQYTPALNLQQTLGVLFTKATIVAEAGSNSLLIRAEKAEAEEIEALVKRLDVVAVAVPQGPIATPSAPPTYHAPSLQPSPFVSFGSTDTLPRQPARMATAESRANELAVEYRELSKNALDAAEDQRPKLDELKKRLEQSVTAAFDERQKSQAAELEALRHRLNQIETSIKTREKNREAIINRRVEELINPDVKWDAASATQPPRLDRNPPAAALGSASPPPRSLTRAVASSSIPPDSNGVNDDPAIGGVWVVISQVESGHDRMKMDDPYRSCIIAGNKMSLIRQSNRTAEECVFKLDPNHRPAWIDVSTISDDLVSKGIYKLEGDILTICMTDPGAERPTEFEAKAGSGAMLVVLQRKDHAAGQSTLAPSSTPNVSDHEAILGEWMVESSMEGGKPSEDRPSKMVITQDFLIMTDGKKTQIATYKLDPTKSPKWIEVQPENDSNPPKAIYRLQGDELILCAAKGDAKDKKDERPTAFESKPDSPNYALVVFKRAKTKALTVPNSPPLAR